MTSTLSVPIPPSHVTSKAVRTALTQHSRLVLACDVGKRTSGSAWSRAVDRLGNTGTFTWATPSTDQFNLLRSEVQANGCAAVLLQYARVRPRVGGPLTTGYCGLLIVTNCSVSDQELVQQGWDRQLHGFQGCEFVPLDWWHDRPPPKDEHVMMCLLPDTEADSFARGEVLGHLQDMESYLYHTHE